MTQRFFLFRELVKRDLESRYAGSALGLAWSFALPMWTLLLYGLVFGTVLRVPLKGERTSHFAVFLFCGLLPWNALQEGVLRATTAITDNANLVKKMRFPSQLLVLTPVASALIQQGIALSLFLLVLAWVGDLAITSLPQLLIALPLQVLLTAGLSLLLATLQVFFRDVAQVVGLAFSSWFFLTPIVYPLQAVPTEVQFGGWSLPIRRVIELNPATALVGSYRQAFLSGEWSWVPGTTSLALFAVGLFALGWWIFGRFRADLVDLV